MSLQTLTGVLQQQAGAASGKITVNEDTLKQATLTCTGLDALLTGSYALPAKTFLEVDTTGFIIPNPQGDTLTVQGRVSVLSLTPANTLATLVFQAGANNTVSLIIRIDLSSWTFATSFPYMNGYPFTDVTYTLPTLVFSSAAVSDWAWQPFANNGQQAANIDLAAGQNYASWMQMNQALKPYTGFLSNFIPGTNLPLSGPFDLSKYNPTDETDPVIYPDLELEAPITGIPPFSISILNVATPSIGISITEEPEKDPDDKGDTEEDDDDDAGDDTPTTTQTAAVFFRLQVQIGSKWLDFTSVAIPGTSIYTFNVAAADGITPQDLFAAVGGQSYTEVMPVMLQQFFSIIAFKGLSATITTNNGFTIQSLNLIVGANVSATNPWKTPLGIDITQLDLNWLIMNPGKSTTQFASLDAKLNFLPSVFKDPFDLTITSDMQVTGGYSGTVQLGDVVNAATSGAIQLPSSVNVAFSDFNMDLNFKDNSYQFSGSTEIEIDLFGNNKFKIDNCNFYLGAVVPTSGATQFSAGISGTIWINSFGLQLSADYKKGTDDAGWNFKGGMPDGQTLSLGDILQQFGLFDAPPDNILPMDLVVSNVRAEAFIPATGSGTYGVGGKVDWKFNMSGAGQAVDISADMWVKYDGSKPSGQQFSGYIQGELNITAVNANVIIRYDFDGKDKLLTLMWAGFTAKYDITKSILEFDIPSWNLGEIITKFMEMVTADTFELEAPWDLLNKVDLPALKVVYNFGVNPSTVSATVTFPATINLIFIQISGITLTKDANGTFINFVGTFQGKPIGSGTPLDGKQNVQNLPAPTGQGPNILDLRLVALGQHISINGYQDFNSVDAVIKAMKNITNPASGQVPVLSKPQPGQPMFNEQSNWLIAMDFGLLKYQDNPTKYSVELEVVFNDPNLYGLRLALDGDKVKFLAGLVFEIMYKKITDSVGMYKAELTLPKVIRTIDCGAFSITLPTFGIEIYTNGDFKVDIGFPYNLDFSKSFTFQAIVYGVPVLGAGGLYFGKLSSATSKDVPKTTLGEFNPVLIFGIGLQVGVGRSIDYGILKAGFSITIVGIIEGVIATWHPYDSGNTNAPSKYNTSNQVAGNYYFKLKGSIGLLGILYGSVDFSIIKATVNIKVYVTISATYESYRKMPLAIEAGVEVDLDVKIDLGLFSIKISFSFHMKIREELTIGHDEQAPWDGGSKMLSKGMPLPAKGLGNDEGCSPIPLSFKRSSGATLPLNLWFAPHLTVSGDPNAAYSAQKAQYVAMLYVPSPNAKDGLGNTPTDFENLANAIFNWVLNAMQTFDPAAVTATQLCQLYATLTQTTRPIVQGDILNFLQDNFTNVNITGLNANVDNASFFPMFPNFTLTAPPLNGGGGATVDFSNFASVDEDYIKNLITYFNQLLVQVQNEMGGAQQKGMTDPTLISLAQFVFEDYFTMIARQMVQSAQECLKKYEYPLQNNDSLATIAATMNKAGNKVSATGLANANAKVLLSTTPALTIAGLMVSPVVTDSVATVAQSLPIDPATLILQNKDNPAILAPNTVVKFQSKTYTIQPGDTFTSVATALSTDINTLAGNADVQNIEGIFIASSPVLGAGLRTTVATGNKPQTLAAKYGTTATALILFNALVPQLVAPVQKLTFGGNTYTTNAGDTLTTVATGLKTTLATLAADPDFQTNQSILLPLAAVLIPPFTTKAATGDTLQAFADRYGVTLTSLFSWYANAQQQNLFDASVKNIEIPELDALSLSTLVAAIRASNSVASLGGMISRFHLHGLRLPTEGVVFAKPATAPCSGLEDCSLYALTGQQFSLPAFKTGDTYSIQLTKANLDWIHFDNVAQNTLTLPIAATAVTSIQTILTYAQGTGFQPAIQALGQGNVFREDPKTFNFSTPVNWQAASNIPLPNNQLQGQISQQLRLWAFPDNLMQLIQGPQASASYSVRLGSKNEAAGPDTPTSKSYAWSTLVSFSLRRLTGSEVDGPASAFSYELIGATQTGITLLERLLSVIRPDNLSAIDNLRLLYAPNPTGQLDGLLSDDDGAVAAFITQSNLSTFTNPDSLSKGLFDSGAGAPPVTSIRNNFYDFIKMLWEASITRSGGFYLYYNQQTEGRGLPDIIFNEHGEANLELLISYKAPAIVTDYMNYAVTADTIDVSNIIVYANAESQVLTYPYQSSDTLAGLTNKYNATVLDIAEGNGQALLNKNLVLDLKGIAITAGPANSNPTPTADGIAKYFNVTTANLTALNPQITQWNPIPVFSLVKIPDTTYTVPGDTTTFQSVANYFRMSLGEIAWLNQGKSGFFKDGAPLQIDNQPVLRTSLTPQGNVGLELIRTQPDPVPAPTDPNYAKDFLENIYSMLAYSLTATPGFKAQGGGLPAGPSKNTDPAQLQNRPKLLQANTSGIWDFNLSAPVARYAIYNPIPDTPGLPTPEGNPYAGVGALAQIYLMWSDYFGNYTPSPLTLPAAGGILNNPILPVGYTDTIVGFSAWPSVNLQYNYGGSTPALTVNFHFDPGRYEDSSNSAQGITGDPIGVQHAREDLNAYTQIYYQINQTYVSGGSTYNTVDISLDATLCPGVDGTLTSAEFTRVATYVTAIYTYLSNIIQGKPATAPADIQLTRNVAAGDINPASIFELQVALSIIRDLAFVHPDFKDQQQVVQSVTAVQPPVVGVDGTGGTIDAFAQAFEEAFAVAGSYQLKLATGTDKEGVTNSKTKDLWVVRIGLTNTQSIYFDIPQTPAYFALPPLSNKLESHTVSLYPYIQGQGIDYDATPVPHNFTGIDMDAWAQNFLLAMDQFLTPDYANPAFITDLLAGNDEDTGLLSEIRGAKETLAGAIVKTMQAAFQDANPSQAALDDAKEALRQQILILLSNAYSVAAAVQYPVTASTNIVTSGTAPRLYGSPDAKLALPPRAVGDDDEDGKTFSITNAKVQLPVKNDTSTQYLTFLLSAKDVQYNADLNLTLSYTVSHVEFEIGNVPGIKNYQASSWLAFLRPDAVIGTVQAPLVKNLGTADVPLVLRVYPTPPSLVAQTATGDEGGTTAAEKIARATAWDFGFRFSHDNAAQDRFYGRMDFNILPPAPMFAKGMQKSLYETLAEFITYYPSVLQDLQTYLTQVNLKTDPKSQNFKNALGALTAFQQMVTDVATAWQSGPIVPPPQPSRFMAKGMGDAPVATQYAYPFGIVQENVNDLLQVTFNTLPPVDKLPIPEVDQPVVNIPGYDPVPPAPAKQGDPAPANTWNYKSQGDGKLLGYQAGLMIADREIDTDGLNVLQYQNARASIYLTRNEILAGKAVNTPFVYTTPSISFSNNLVPLLSSSTEINAGELMTGKGPWPLWTILQAFFGELFKSDVLSQQNIMVECRYSYPYPGTAGLPNIELPVLLSPPFDFAIPNDYQPAGNACAPAPQPTDAYVCRLAAGITAWWQTRLPVTANGHFVLNVSIFSALDEVKLPIAQLQQVIINITDIDGL